MTTADETALTQADSFVRTALEHDGPGETALLGWTRSVVASAALPQAGGNPAVLTVEPGSLRPIRVGRHPLVAVRVRAENTSHDVVLKSYRDDRGAETLRLLAEVSDAGLTRPSRDAVTRGLGWSGQHRALVTERAPGMPWRVLLHAPEPWRTAGSAAVGRWLATLQCSDADLPVRVSFRDMADMDLQAKALGALLPEQADRLADLACAAARLDDTPPAVLVPSHGDLHPNNIHLMWSSRTSGPAPGSPVVTALDLDTVGLRRPAYDAGYALAQLLVMSWLRRESLVPGAMAGHAFWRRWARSATASSDQEAVPAQFARALVQSLHYELAVLRNGRDDLAPAWCLLAETAMCDGMESLLERLLTAPSVVEDMLSRGSGWRRHRRNVAGGLS